MKHTKQLFLLLLLAIVSNVAAWGETTDVLTTSSLEITSSNSYANFSDKTISSEAVYAGNAKIFSSNNSIQLRTDNNNSGIVTTASGGQIVSVEIEWADNTTPQRTLDIYGKNSAYSAASDLYNTSKQGTKLGSFTYSSSTVQTATLEVSGDYQYIGIRSKSGALYLNYIKITWSNGDSYSITPQSNNTDYGTVSISGNTITATPAAGYQVSTTNPYTVTSGTATVTDNGDNTFTVSTSGDCTVQINFEAIPVVTHLSYQKVTSTEDIEDGKKYLIVYEEGSVAFDGSLSTLDAASNNQEVVINNGTIKTDANIFFTIDKTAGTILSASGKYIGSNTDANGMNESSSTDYTNTITINGENVDIVGRGGAYLRYNFNSDQKRFRYFKSSTYSSQKAIQLYKEGTVNIEIAAPEISPDNGTQITEKTPITITGAEGTTIYYTTDGSDPVKDGALTGTAKAYTGAFTLSKAGTVKAVARDAGGNFSEIVSATYTYNGTVTAPYYENFDEGLGNFTVETEERTDAPEWIFRISTGSYGTRKYAYVNGSDKQGTTRLVSPVIDLTDETIQNVTLSFVHAGRYFDGYNAPSCTSEQTADGNAPTHAQVFVREENGTWKQVTIPNWFTQAGSDDTNIYERINSGEIPLDDYKGKKIQVSFLYTADGINQGDLSTGIWNVLKFALTTTQAEVENYEIVEMKTDGFVTYVVQNDIDVAKTLENNTKEQGANVHIYKVTEFSKTEAVFGKFGYGENETVIPAETPVIIKGTKGENKLVIAKGGDIIAKPANNLLLPSYGDVAPTDEQHLLVFQKTSDWNEEEPYSNYAFFKLKTGRTIPNRKAYLNGTDFKESITTQTNPAKGIFLMEDLNMDYEIPLGVETVNTTNRAQNTGIFDLMGRKVADKAEDVSVEALQKGVYIVNGRKVVIK